MNIKLVVSTIILIARINAAFAEEKFKSLIMLRKELAIINYGPSMNEIFPFKIGKKLNVQKCVVYRTEHALSEEYAYSSLSVAGRKIVKKTGELNKKEQCELLKLIFDYSNYGDVFVGVFEPTIAIEFVCGKDTFVLNYCDKSNTVSISSARVDSDLVLAHWSKPVLASPRLRLFIIGEGS